MLNKPLINTDDGFNSVIKGREGFIIYNKNDEYVGKSIEKYGEFSQNEVTLFEAFCSPGHMVVDVGANIGTHTLAFSRLVGSAGRVFAYEPQRIVFQTLCGNLALNSITNVECMQQGLGDKDGHVLIPDINYNMKGNNYGGVQIDKFTDGNKVGISTLDKLLYLPRLNFIKIDVEGMEYSVISGGLKVIEKFKPALYVENDHLDKSKALIKLIRSLDYRIFWHGPRLYNEDNYAGNSDNIYNAIVSMNMLCVHSSVKINISLLENNDPDFHPMRC